MLACKQSLSAAGESELESEGDLFGIGSVTSPRQPQETTNTPRSGMATTTTRSETPENRPLDCGDAQRPTMLVNGMGLRHPVGGICGGR